MLSLQRSAQSYISGASSYEVESGHGRRTRFAREDHHTQIREGREVVEQWGPGPDVPTEP